MAAVAAPTAEAQAQAEEPSPPRPPPPEKRAAPTDAEEGEERPEPKRRRARVAALEKVPSAAAAAAAASEEEEDDGFSFLARSFSGVETTPKFGSFNPAAAQFVAFHLAPPPPLVDPAEAEAGSPPVVVGGDGEEKGKDGNSH